MQIRRDHGGGLDAPVAQFGGLRREWLDLSTGINPVPYPIGEITQSSWNELPDRDANDALVSAARLFWSVPDAATIIPASGASALIAAMPRLHDGSQTGTAYIPTPTYNEHAAAFENHGIKVSDVNSSAPFRVFVHPNNPDGRLWRNAEISSPGALLTVIDESFCDVTPAQSHIARATEPGVVILKSFGKFWGLAGLRLGFAIAHPDTVAATETNPSLRDMLGPWSVSGPALTIGTNALRDTAWAMQTRERLHKDAARLDTLMARHGALIGGTDLFRLYDVGNATSFQERLARHRIWSRVFPYSEGWIRLGLPAPQAWPRLEAAL